MKRVFFYTGFHLKVFEFDGNAFIGALDFYDTEGGKEEFAEYIASAVAAQTYLLVDLQDEDFRTESLPHVRGRDQKQLLARLEERIFRDIDYRQTISLGRAKSGRRDDTFMFSSLVNTEVLDRWMELFAEHKVPICGIWSVSYLGEEIIRALDAKEETILLFSRQMRSAIRETIFKGGRIRISRQAKLERRVRNDHSAETLATILASNVDVMHRFLINQRMVSYADTIHVYAIIQDSLIEKAQDYCDDSPTLKFRFIGIDSLFRLFNIKNCEAPRQADVLFAYLCSNQKPAQQQYLPRRHRAPYRRFQVNEAVHNLSLVLSLTFMVLAGFFLLNANEYAIEARALTQKKQALEDVHSRLYSTQQQRIDEAERVRETVALVQRIEGENAMTPQSLFPPLSQTFDRPQFDRFSLDTLIWEKFSPRQLQAITAEYRDPALIQTSEEEIYFDEPTEGALFQSVLRLGGRLDTAGLSYQQAVFLMQEFTRSIQTLEDIAQLHVVQSPVDLRAGTRFSDRSGLEASAARDASENTRYELRVIFAPVEGADDASEE